MPCGFWWARLAGMPLYDICAEPDLSLLLYFDPYRTAAHNSLAPPANHVFVAPSPSPTFPGFAGSPSWQAWQQRTLQLCLQ